MDKERIFEYLGTELNEDGVECHQYSYKFSTGTVKLGEDDGDKYCGISTHDSIVYMSADMFRWDIIKYVFKHNLEIPEEFHEFMKKFNPNYDTPLEDLKKSWNSLSDDLLK